MTRLRSLIKEVLSQPKKKDCNCGCNTCGDKAPILTESKFKSLISEGLQHHIDKKISLFESVYRIGSEKHLELIREARALWVRGIIEVSDDDKGLLETHLGHFGLYEGVEVPLDLPMVEAEIDYEKEKTWKIQDKFPIEVTVKKGWTGNYYTIEPKPMDISYDTFIDLGSDGDVSYSSYNYITGEANWTSDSLEQIKQWEENNQDRIKVIYPKDINESREAVSLDLPMVNEVEKDINQLKNLSNRKERYNYIKNFSKEKLIDIADELYLDYEEYDDIEDKVLNSFSESLNEGFYSSPSDLEDSGLNVIPKDQIHANKLQDALENSGLYGEWNPREGYFFFPEEEDGYDYLEEKIQELMDDYNIQGYIEGVFEESLDESQDKWVVYDTKTKEILPNAGKVYKNREKAKKFVEKLKDSKVDAKVADAAFYYYNLQKKKSVEERINNILEAKKKKKKKKKDPKLNKPKRGGSKAYYVYVRDPKTKKIIKVSFGSGGLRAKIKNKEARNAFAARHNCKNKKDRTSPGYWSCNLPRYADQLGLGSKMNTFW